MRGDSKKLGSLLSKNVVYYKYYRNTEICQQSKYYRTLLFRRTTPENISEVCIELLILLIYLAGSEITGLLHHVSFTGC